jgi:Kdo2-lipid IVA lauroyltransferase/acyltransferase
MRNLFKFWIRYPLEALAAILFYLLFAILPVGVASAVGGFAGRTIGPLIPVTKRARDNIEKAMPETTSDQRQLIIRGMWENLGRVVAEYPHIRAIARDAGRGGRVEIVGVENTDAMRPADKPGIMFSAHLANWEVFALSVSAVGFDYAQVYRAPNNRIINWLIHLVRRLPEDKQIPKGAEGARMAITILKAGGEIGMLVDQKMNDGISAPFFGHEAMSPPAVAQLGLRYNCTVVPVRLERTNGCHFRLTFLPPMELIRTGDRHADALAMMIRVNEMLEDWIRARPEQWLWLHQRWPK